MTDCLKTYHITQSESELKIKEILYRINSGIERILPYIFPNEIKVIFASRDFKNRIIELGKHIPLSSPLGNVSHDIVLNKRYELMLFLTEDDIPPPRAPMWEQIKDFIVCSLSYSSLHFLNLVSGYGSRGTDIIHVCLHQLDKHPPIVGELPAQHSCAPQYLLENIFKDHLITSEDYCLMNSCKAFKHFDYGDTHDKNVKIGDLYQCDCGQILLTETQMPLTLLGEIYERQIEQITTWNRDAK